MHPMLNIAIRAARAGGAVIVRHVDRLDTVSVSEKSRNDFVSDVDRQAEAMIVDTIRKSYPDHAILAEESGAMPAGGSGGDYRWIIDPLDGTNNFLHGYPHFAVSVALEVRGQLDQGVIFDPLRQELFTASRGAGAQLDGKRIRVVRGGVATALLATGLPFREIANLDAHLQSMAALMPEAAGLRRSGSAALDLAYVAAGRIGGFWEYGLAPWDMAAGALLVREAGGIVSDPLGGDDFMNSGHVLAASPKVHREMLPHLTRATKRIVNRARGVAQA